LSVDQPFLSKNYQVARKLTLNNIYVIMNPAFLSSQKIINPLRSFVFIADLLPSASISTQFVLSQSWAILLSTVRVRRIHMTVISLGALLFGVVIGWVTYRTLRRQKEAVALSNIATVIAAVGGAAVTALFKSEELFAWYCIGLFLGFLAYLIVGIARRDVDWLTTD
jgi:hypothetical protein